MSLDNAPTSRFGGFDGIRFIAALAVIATHAGLMGWLAAFDLQHLKPLLHGSTGVTAFYVLSGFLITHLLLKEYATTGTISLRHFLLRRALRLYPLYYLVLGLVLISGILGGRATSPTSLGYAAAYAYNFIPRSHYDGWLGSFHTLATEEHFYFVYPLVFLVLSRRALWTALPTLLAFLVVAAPVLSTYLSAGFGSTHFVSRWTPIAAADIALGCLAACYYAKDPHRFLAGRALWGWAGLTLYIAPVLITGLRTTGLGLTFLVMWIVASPRARLVAVLERPVLRYFGQASYGLYVWQAFFLSTGPGRRWPDSLPLAVAFVFVATVVSWELVEKPVLALKTRIGYPAARRAGLQSREGVASVPAPATSA